ncbi:hypothetical protein ACS0TY_006102 [Phlomoides rotata]
MKFQTSELPLGKPQPRRKASKLAPLIALTILLTIPLYYPFLSKDSTKKLTQPSPIYQDLEDSITLPSHAEPPPIETAELHPCSGRCDGGGEAAAADHHHVRKKRDKGRRKRIRKRQPISRSDDQIISNVISTSSDRGMIRSQVIDDEQCDLFSGQWVPNPDGPYYTNDTCDAIQEHQNCLKFGRPDTGFLNWRWRPDDCELPMFEPNQFLQLLRGKSIAFVGDSVARNHMQSLICLLSRVEYPIDVSRTSDEHFKRWKYVNYNFTMFYFWAPYLIRSNEREFKSADRADLFKLYLDELDVSWTTQIDDFDYIIINAGHWFDRISIYHENRRVVGCRQCKSPKIADLPATYGYRRAFRTAIKAINDRENFTGVTILRTYAPSHFENGLWNAGGNCVRQRPFRSDEINLEGLNLDMYMAQLDEFRAAEKEGKKRFRLLDTTQAMLLRPDGHPSRYGHRPDENVTLYNDCVHWCLPGPVDSWADLLLHILKKEVHRERLVQNT